MRRCPLHLERAGAVHFVRSTSLTLLTSVLMTATVHAQASRTDQPFSVTFQTSGQSMWGPGSALFNNSDGSYSFADVSWDKSGSTPGVTTVAGQNFGGDLSAASRGAFGVFADFRNIGTGAVSVNYPVVVTMGLPDANTFHEGQTISIPTDLDLRDGATIATNPPRGDITFSAKAKLTASATGRLCFFDCVTQALFPSVDIGSDYIPLMSLTVDPEGTERGSISTYSFTLPHTLTFLEQQVTNMSGTVGLPKVVPVSSVETDGFTLNASASNTFVDLSLDLDGFFTGKVPLGFQSPKIHGVQMGYETVDFSGVLQMTQSQAFRFVPTVWVRFEFPRDVPWWETDEDGNTVGEGTGRFATIHAGNTLNLTYPAGLRDPMTVSPSFLINNSFSNQTVTEAREDLVLTVGKFNLTVPATTVVPEVTADVCYETTVELDFADVIPDESCPVTTPAVTSPAININLGPLYQTSVAGRSQRLNEFPNAGAPGSWELQGFTTQAGTNFVLDPENPMLSVATSLTSGLASGTGPAGTLTQNITVRNLGDVPLSRSQIADALTRAVASGGAFTVRSITTVLHSNAGFNGTTDPATLTRADVLAVGGSGVVTVSLGVGVGNQYHVALNADGTSPIGTTVRASAGASFSVYSFDIMIRSLSEASTGVLPVTLFSTPGMDVRLIAPGSLRLVGVAPLRWDQVTRADGGVDLTLKFDRDAVRAALEATLTAAIDLPGLETLDARMVAKHLLGEGGISAEQLAIADRNRNGVLDIGDLRALLGRSGGPKLDPGEAPKKPEPESRPLVLTGALKDGTPLMGEDNLITKGGGQ